MSIHCILSESSMSAHCGKGREGKGREVGHACIVSTGSARARFATTPAPAVLGNACNASRVGGGC